MTSNFSFSHSVFKRIVSQGRQKVSLCGNGLTLSQTTNLDSFILKEFAYDKLIKMAESFKMDRKQSKRAISPFPTVFFKRLVWQIRENQGLFGKGLMS